MEKKKSEDKEYRGPRGQLLSGARTAKQCEKTKNKEEEEEEEVKKRWICKGQYAMRTD